MKRLTSLIGLMLLAFSAWAATAPAQSLFTIDDPPVDFEVVDAEPFDGIGDNGPYATFADALLGTLGECRSMAEFDISAFILPPDEVIASATLEVRITAIEIYGLGVNGETPEYLAVDGYVGDGVASLSDFQAGDGNLLDTVPTPAPYVGQVVSFDITPFVREVVAVGEPYLGLAVRAGTFGGMWVGEGSGYPRLTIETQPDQSGVARTDTPAGLVLRQNVPNPFTSETRIDYCVPRGAADPVVVGVYGASGRLVRTLKDGPEGPGAHSVIWDGCDRSGKAAPSGVYFCRLSCGGMSETRRILLVR